MLSDQEIFDKAVRGMSAQGFLPSMNETGDLCMYRGEHGRKCPIGHLLHDEHYSPTLEAHPQWSRQVRAALARSGVVALERSTSVLLGRLQYSHDEYNATAARIRARLMRLAEDTGLTWPEEA